VRHNRSRMRPTQRWANRMLIVLAVMAGMGTMAAPASASLAAPTAETTSVLTPRERADLPAGARKVTRAGLVHGKIPAQIGDIVLAATVLHASETIAIPWDNNGPGGQPVRVRIQRAIEENTSNQVRGYWRFRLVYGDTVDNTWATYHEGSLLRVHRWDGGTNQADGCLAPPNHCTWSIDPSGCRGSTGPPCGYYIRTSLYRAKGDAADWWLTEFREYQFWHPNLNKWETPSDVTCGGLIWRQGLWWRVGGGTSEPDICPYPEGV
jgi:hypothetical protein